MHSTFFLPLFFLPLIYFLLPLSFLLTFLPPFILPPCAASQTAATSPQGRRPALTLSLARNEYNLPAATKLGVTHGSEQMSLLLPKHQGCLRSRYIPWESLEQLYGVLD